MNQYDPSGKIQRVANGALMPPGACFCCGSASHSVYALLGHTEWEGSVYICESCALGVMSVFETLMLPANEKALRDQIYSLERDSIALRGQIRTLEKDNESYRLVFSRAAIRSPVPSVPSSVLSETVAKNSAPDVKRSEGFVATGDALADTVVSNDGINVQQLIERTNETAQQVSPRDIGPVVLNTETSDRPASSESKGIVPESDNSSNEASGDSGESSSVKRRDSSTGSRRKELVGNRDVLGSF